VSTQGGIKCEMWEVTLILSYKTDIIWEKRIKCDFQGQNFSVSTEMNYGTLKFIRN